ncbi:DUF2950 domain-containing protein [Oryzomonas sagensis]|uniref:DUF2950 domain-containing protein n=1 Tax=Oryzomonas sagensis TaxID=2603857 RepID=UPI001FE30FC4|nr:DUF2950 domain-containing protein [Oryzomonas sagensis]
MMTERGKVLFRGLGAWCLAALLAVVAVWPAVGDAAPPVPLQQSFASPEAARQALVDAVQHKDHGALARIFGPVAVELEPGDPVEQAAEFDHFSRHVQEGIGLVREGETRAILVIGAKKWPFPVPIVKRGDTWLFNMEEGREEIVNRRVGHNELLAINVCRAYVDAQREYYAMAEPDGEQLPKYAQRMISRPGRKDGLYWPTAAGEKESPLGPLVAKAKEEGYMRKHPAGDHGPRPYHGYYFRILTRQGKNAPGGRFSYVINNNMVAGYALVAYPAKWGVSGVMTFIVNQRGRVYEKNLGPKTAEIARKLKGYNPDLTWKLVDQ